MTQPEPELRRVEPTGDPRVDALIDAMVCPSCRTIYNAAKAKCGDLWHRDNQPATGGIVETGPALVAEDGGCVMPPKLTLRFTDEAEVEFMERIRAAMIRPRRITVLPPDDDEREQAAYESGVADLGDGYHELEVAHGRWYWLDDLGIRVMVDRRPPYAVLRWKPLTDGQATKGWEREWGIRWIQNAADPTDDMYPCSSESEARAQQERSGGYRRAESRLVGPWEPAEQPCGRAGLHNCGGAWCNHDRPTEQDGAVTDAQYADQFQRIAASEAVILADELAGRGDGFGGPAIEQVAPRCTCPMVDVTNIRADGGEGIRTFMQGLDPACPTCVRRNAEQDGDDRG